MKLIFCNIGLFYTVLLFVHVSVTVLVFLPLGSTVSCPNLAKMSKMGFLRLSYEKQDTLLKLLILSMAAILCESSTFTHTPEQHGLADTKKTKQTGHIDPRAFLSLQHSPPDSFPS